MTRRESRLRGVFEIVGGFGLALLGLFLTMYTFSRTRPGGVYFGIKGVIGLGTALFVRGLVRLVPFDEHGGLASHGREPLFHFAPGFTSFVAWRYLLVNPPRVRTLFPLAAIGCAIVASILWLVFDVQAEQFDPFHDLVHGQIAGLGAIAVLVIVFGVVRFSRPCFGMFWGGALLAINSFIIYKLVPFDLSGGEDFRRLQQVANVTMIIGAVIAFIGVFFGVLRAYFTFFTTVPIGGVWIGTAALVCVLAVMSGFESDLREKILGSNAHIQVTREDGEFVNWRDVKKRIDQIPGVVASTPYAVSEVVIAANNNGMNVIIKGIDPATVGTVTDLVSDLVTQCPPAAKTNDREAMQKLLPLVPEVHDRSVPQKPRAKGGLDPLPDDMPSGGDPIDFSGGGDPDAPKPDVPKSDAPAPEKKDAGSGATIDGKTGLRRDDIGSDRHTGLDPDLAPPSSPYGGDATRIIDLTDEPRPPGKLLKWATGTDEPDTSLGGPSDSAISVTDLPLEPVMSRRTQALPGVLVGCELVKQTHLFTGQEVRVVSPLSDPSNPDATGTPIPFNRDYRVAGFFYTGMYEYDLKYVYVSLDSLQDFLDRGDGIDGIEVRVQSADDTGRYVPDASAPELHPGLIREALGPGYRVQDWRELNRSLFSALKLEKIAMFLVLGIVILVASFSIVGNLIMVVVEKGREIALLKTLGASDFGVMRLFAIQGVFIGLIGTTLGVLFGLGLCMLGKKFGLPLDPDVYYINRLPIHVDTQAVMAAAAAGILISVAATLYPALLATRVRPAAGMRQ